MATTPPATKSTDASLYGIKPRFVRALDPIRETLERRGTSPNTVTLAAIPVEIAVAVCLVVGTSSPAVLALVPVLCVVWMGLNALDGSLARSSGRSSTMGAVLNELVDRAGDLAIIGAAFVVAPPPIGALVAVTVLTTELIAAVGWATTGRRDFPGPMGKPDRAAVVAIGAVVAIVWPPALPYAFVVIAIGAGIGAAMRLRSLLRHAHRLDAEGRR